MRIFSLFSSITLIQIFPFLALLFSACALLNPQWFTGLRPSIVPLLGLIMFCMGASLKPIDFLPVFKQPSTILLGLGMQFSIMPVAAWLIALGLKLDTNYLIGMVLVGACSGGTASNVICYLAKGDVALSISLTACSTLLATFATPLLTFMLIGQTVDVPAQKMLLTILYVIALPVIAGMVFNRFVGKRLDHLRSVYPLLSVLAISLIIAVIVALNHENLQQLSFILFIAIILHNAIGLSIAYFITRALGHSIKTAKTLAIEVGMQNSGLAVVLASKYFSAMSALPAAIFSIWHNLSGSALAAYWSSKAEKSDQPVLINPK